MLVNATNMLLKARDGHYGVGQFNINNLEWTRSILLQAQAMQSPVILGVSEGAGKYMTGFKTVAAMVRAMDESLGITVPVALHLDHGTYEGCKACVEAGFSSIMFDGSHYSIEENVEKTKELVALAHAHGMSIEAEVGSIGGVEDGVVGAGEIADPEECAKITALGIDFLAAGIGNIHGVYPANWKGLDFEALDRIHKATNNIPLVLHGGTGIVRSLRRGSGTQRRDHGSAHDQYDKGDERGARNAAEHARNDTRAQREHKGDGKEGDGKHQAGRAERDTLGQQRHQHLEGRGARARNGQTRTDSQIHRRDKKLAKLGMHAAGKLSRRSSKCHGDKAHDGKADGGNEKAEHGERRGRARLQRQQRRNNEVAGAKEHREQGDADGEDMVGAQTARGG